MMTTDRLFLLLVPVLLLVVAGPVNSKSTAGYQYRVGVSTTVWHENAEGGVTSAVRGAIQSGEPLFLRMGLIGSGSRSGSGQAGLDGPTLPESSIEVLVTRDLDFRLKEREVVGAIPAGPNEPKARSMLTFGEAGPARWRVVSAVVWFLPDPEPAGAKARRDQSGGTGPSGGGADAAHAAKGGGKPGGPRRLVFEETGLDVVWTRLPRLLLPYESVTEPKYAWWAAAAHVAVDVYEPDPLVKAFAADVARVVSADLIVPPEHRAVLERYAAPPDGPAAAGRWWDRRVRWWAQWLLLRSHLGDDRWRAGLHAREPAALREFEKLAPAARQFLEPKWMWTAPAYEAKLFLAAEFSSRGKEEAALAEPGVAEVLNEYVGARAVWASDGEDDPARASASRGLKITVVGDE